MKRVIKAMPIADETHLNLRFDVDIFLQFFLQILKVHSAQTVMTANTVSDMGTHCIQNRL